MALPIPGVVKEHPYLTIGGIVGVVLLFVIINGASGAAVDTSASGDSGSVMDPMAAINAQLAAHSSDVAAAQAVQQNENATKITLAQLNSADARYAADKAAELQEASLHTQEVLAQAQLAAQQNITTATLNAQTAQTNAILKNNTELAKIAAQPKGLFSWLFG